MRTRRRSVASAAAIQATSARRERASIRRPVAERCLFGVDSIRWRCSLRGCRSGSRRSPPTGRSRSSIITCESATAFPAPGSRACEPRPCARKRRPRSPCSPMRWRPTPSRGAASPVSAGDRPERHRCTGARQGTGARGACRSWHAARELEARRGCVVRRLAGVSSQCPPSAFRGAVGRDPDRVEARFRRARPRGLARARRWNERRASGSFTGSSSSRKSSSSPDGNPPAGRAASTRSSATRRGTWCAPTASRMSGRGTQRQRPRSSGSLRDAGVYDARPDGHANRYQLFVERAMALIKPGGRIGLVLPSGMIADQPAARLRRSLFSRCGVERVVGFDNRAGTFPIHRSVKFILLSARSGSPTGEIACRFGETDPRALERAADADGRPAHSLVHDRASRRRCSTHLSGDDLSIPDLRSPLDLGVSRARGLVVRAAGIDRTDGTRISAAS